jgi:hypothetical protein
LSHEFAQQDRGALALAGLAVAVVVLGGCGDVSPGASRDDAGADAPRRRDAATSDARADAFQRGDATSVDDATAPIASIGCDSGTPAVECVAAVGGIYATGGPLAVDDASVYWTVSGQTGEEDVVMRPPLHGGASALIAHASPMFSLVSDGAHLYWSDFGGGKILSVPVDGGSVKTITSGVQGYCVVVDDTSVYWTDEDSMVGSAPKGGGMPTWIGVGSTAIPTGIAVDATSVYWSGGGVYRASKEGGGQVTTLYAGNGTDIPGCEALVLSGATLFFTHSTNIDETDREVVSIPVDGSSAPNVVVSTGSPYLLAAGSTDLFWLGTATAFVINETPLQGGPSTALAMPVAHSIEDIALSHDGVLYWLSGFQLQSLTP